jgi:hypothetical protein
MGAVVFVISTLEERRARSTVRELESLDREEGTRSSARASEPACGAQGVAGPAPLALTARGERRAGCGAAASVRRPTTLAVCGRVRYRERDTRSLCSPLRFDRRGVCGRFRWGRGL